MYGLGVYILCWVTFLSFYVCAKMWFHEHYGDIDIHILSIIFTQYV